METIGRKPALSSKAELFVGTLSGTSMDGIDAVLVGFAPQPVVLGSHTLSLPAALKEELQSLCAPGETEIDRLGRADVELGHLFGQAIRELVAKADVDPKRIRAVGSHGQTIRHRPGFAPAFTLQIGDPNVIAVETGLTVVADFRRKDLALGGQGAPLVPAFHEAVFRQGGKDRVIVNIGGIANLTSLPGAPNTTVLGFDTGPGNTLLDGWSRRVLNAPMDRDGALAASGHIVPRLLNGMLADPYFSRPAPKSTGPELFSMRWLEQQIETCADPLDNADVQATLVALTAQSIADAVKALPGLTRPEVYVCGGGALNVALMTALRENLPASTVGVTDTLGVPTAWVEALAFAWFARQRLHGLPGNLPAVTGAKRPAVLGGIYLPN